MYQTSAEPAERLETAYSTEVYGIKLYIWYKYIEFLTGKADVWIGGQICSLFLQHL